MYLSFDTRTMKKVQLLDQWYCILLVICVRLVQYNIIIPECVYHYFDPGLEILQAYPCEWDVSDTVESAKKEKEVKIINI